MDDELIYHGFFPELRLILGHARQLWALIPRRHKLTYFLALGLIAIVAACNTASRQRFSGDRQ